MSGTKPPAGDIESMVDGWLSETATPSETTEQTTDGEGTSTTPPEGETPKPADDNAQEGQPNGATDKPAGNKERQPEQATKPGPGDLVDGQGRVLARAGAERRHYESAQRATRELGSVKQQLERTTAELNAFREAAHLPQQLGLSVEDTTTGLQLVASWKQNPVGVIQYLVEQAKAAGHNLDGLGGAADVGAIKAMIASELAPFRNQAQMQQAQTEAQTAARSQIDNLVAEYGESALVNSEALAKLIDASTQQGRPLNVEQAYLRFSNWCLQNGYDPSAPIDPQIAAKQSPQAAQPPATQQRMPPRPNGRAPASNGVIPLDPLAGTTGHETTRDLVRAAMREQGFNV